MQVQRMKKKIQPRKRKPSPYVLFMHSNGGTCSLEDLMEAFPAKGKNALLNSMQKLVDNYTVDRDIYIYGDRQKKIIYTLGGYVTKDTTGICWHNPFNLGEVMEDNRCKDHPDAPHGFDRNASHNADRYVCECESWEEPKSC